MSLSGLLSGVLGIPEPALRMLLALVSAYPFAFLYRELAFRVKCRPAMLHIFSIFAGCWMVHYLTGTYALHFLLDIALVYIVLRLWPGSRLSIAFTWLICGVHTSIGYTNQVLNGSVHNPLNWTIPQCVLWMTLVGLLTDIYDGGKKKQEDKQWPNAVTQLPSVLEFAGFCCFFGTVLIGPQFSFKRYISYVDGSLNDAKTHSSVIPGLKRFLVGLIYVSLYGILGSWFPSKYLVSDEYASSSLSYQLLYLFVWGRVYMWMYVSIWTITEGACIITGISYNGIGDYGNPKWDALCNGHVLKFELSYTLESTIFTLNMKTSVWAREYVFTRLKWLKSKPLSHFITLLFLSMWHGLWPGYFITFLLQFILILQERQFYSWLKSITNYQSVNDLPIVLSAPLKLMALVFKSIIMYFALACFALLTWKDCWKFMAAVKYYVLYGIIMWAIFNAVIVRNTKHRTLNEHTKQQTHLAVNHEDSKENLIKPSANGHLKKLLVEE